MIRYGAMLEVPALADQRPNCCRPRIDGSIGTNDLTQFLFAADRAFAQAGRALRPAQPGDPALPRGASSLLRDEAGAPVAVCGEMGGRPLEAMALIGLGIDRLSITPAAVGPVKAMIRSLNCPRSCAR